MERISREQAAARLKAAGLRPTRQRIELARLLFTGQDRHVTAESLAEEGVKAGARVSLATIYNTLHQFQAAGLLRQVIVDAAAPISTPIPAITSISSWKMRGC